jgi:hypothetical protein
MSAASRSLVASVMATLSASAASAPSAAGFGSCDLVDEALCARDAEVCEQQRRQHRGRAPLIRLA